MCIVAIAAYIGSVAAVYFMAASRPHSNAAGTALLLLKQSLPEALKWWAVSVMTFVAYFIWARRVEELEVKALAKLYGSCPDFPEIERLDLPQ